MKHIRKRGFPYFWTIFVSLLLLGVIALCVWLSWLKGFLAEYEGAQCKYIAEDVYNEYFASPDFDALLEKDGFTVSPFETKKALADYLAGTFTGERSYKSVSNGLDGDTVKYIVTAGGTKFAEFTLKKTGELTKHGIALYAADTISLTYKQPSRDFTFTVPEGAAVEVNGTALADAYLTGNITETPSCAFMPEGVTGLRYTDYKIDGLINKPTVRVLDKDGAECAVTENDGHFEAAVNYSEALEAEYGETIKNVVKKYAAYMQSDGRFNSFSKYIDPESLLYSRIRDNPIYFVWDHDGYDFGECNATRFYAYDDNTFSCNVTLLHILHKTGSEDYRDYINMTVYLRKTDDGYLIYDWDAE